MDDRAGYPDYFPIVRFEERRPAGHAQLKGIST